jgi:hypothetical protein
MQKLSCEWGSLEGPLPRSAGGFLQASPGDVESAFGLLLLMRMPLSLAFRSGGGDPTATLAHQVLILPLSAFNQS